MAKLTGPLFSVAAHGSLGGCLTFNTKGSKTSVRFQKKQNDYLSLSRSLQRIKFGVASRIWANLTQAQKDQLAASLRG